MARLTAKKDQWFSIPGDEDKAKVKIIHLTPGDIQKISNDTSRWVGKRENEDFVSELEYQPLEQIKLTRMAAIVDWENFFDADGNKLKCTPANKGLYLNFDPELGVDKESGKPKLFSEWIDLFREELGKDTPTKEALEKN